MRRAVEPPRAARVTLIPTSSTMFPISDNANSTETTEQNNCRSARKRRGKKTKGLRRTK